MLRRTLQGMKRVSLRVAQKTSAIALVAVMLCALVGTASAEEGKLLGPYVPKLAGVTKVSTFHSSSIKVRIPRMATISTEAFFNKSIEIRSSAGFAGIALKQDAKEDGAEIIAMQVATCADLPCNHPPLEFATTGSAHDQKAETMELPAGDYHLFVFVDDSSATNHVAATINLDGLKGRTSLLLGDPMKGSVSDLDPYVDDKTVRPLYSAVTSHPLSGMGISLIGLIIETPKEASEGEVDACLTENTLPLDVPRPHALTCLDGAGSWMTWGMDKGRFALMMDYSMLNAGKFTHSINYRGTTQAKAVRGFEFSLDYEDGVRSTTYSGGVFAMGD